MTDLLTAAGHPAATGVTLSVSTDDMMTKENAMRERATLDQAAGLLAEAYEQGAGTPKADKLVQKATDLLAKGGALLGQEEVAILLAIDATTVSKYRTRSKPGGSMESHPFPASDGTSPRNAAWLVGRLSELFEWMANRPGRGAGGGRPWHADEQPKPELLAGLPGDWWTAQDVVTYLEAIGQKVSRDRLRRYLATEEMPEPDRMIGSEKVWKPAAIRRWRPAPKGVASR